MKKFPSPIDNLWEREMENIDIFRKMERRGVKVNLDIARQEIAVGEGRMHQIRKSLGYNPASNKDLKTLLIDEMGLPVVSRSPKTGAPSFDKNAMKDYEQILANNPQ
ncbi:hypothetical protein, partial [Streptomyces rochei]|uniref:hypothetical protein n=1 Tax=Streptomyces rochei TaxID=1928 RepID=UPI0036A30640